jgi:hypothetical protein
VDKDVTTRFLRSIPELTKLGFSLAAILIAGPYISAVGELGSAVFDWIREKIGDRAAKKLEEKLGLEGQVDEIVRKAREDYEVRKALLHLLMDILSDVDQKEKYLFLEEKKTVEKGLKELEIEFPDLGDELNRIKDELNRIELTLVEKERVKGIYLIRVTAGDETLVARAPFILGRYDPLTDPPGYTADCLAIKTDESIRIFRGTVCRWGCSSNDMDCTHRRHVEIGVLNNQLFIRNLGTMPAFLVSEGKTINVDYRGVLCGKSVKLQISGVYSRKGSEKVPVVIELLGPVGRVTG